MNLPDHEHTILIFDSNEEHLKESLAVVEAAGYDAVVAGETGEATAALEQVDYAAVLLSASDSGRELGQFIREFTPLKAPVIALVPADIEDPDKVARGMCADGFIRAPLDERGLEVFLSVGRQLLEERRRPQAIAQVAQPDLPGHRTGFHLFEDIKDLLVVEVRRAKRYGYPLSILLVRLDPIPAVHQLAKPDLPREITQGLGSAISRSLRVIDLPIQYADDAILVFLPHTDLAGAEEVGRRVKRRIRRITYRDEELTCQITASVGVAGIEAGDNLTFSKLIKNATSALRAAQLKGGDRVMKRMPSVERSLDSSSKKDAASADAASADAASADAASANAASADAASADAASADAGAADPADPADPAS
ncbi:MAG: diguanylate cyclase [Deltaproteobacteria bacterium]|nr:diguanylate cyclase [Deltaproteobacteria bacterium]